MKFSKSFNIEYKIIKKQDIEELLKLLEKQKKEFRKKIKIVFDDDSEKENDNIDIIEREELNRRICKKIYFTYNTNNFDDEVEVCLINSSILRYSSYVKISSNDEVWYNSIVNNINTILEEIEPQNIISKYNILITFILVFIEILLAIIILFNPIQKPINYKGVITSSLSIFLFFITINISTPSHIEKIFPKVEFAFGSDYKNKPKILRKLYVIGIPFLINIILFILGLLFS